MSMVTTLVSLSQFFRTLAVRMRNKAVRAIEDRIDVIQDRQVKLEESRSALMVDCHSSHYKKVESLKAWRKAELARIEKEFETKAGKETARFQEQKRTIAVMSQAKSDELKRELVMLRTELDNLTK